MIKLLVINHKFHYEMEKLVRIFMPDSKIQVIYDENEEYNLLTSVKTEICVIANFEKFNKTLIYIRNFFLNFLLFLRIINVH